MDMLIIILLSLFPITDVEVAVGSEGSPPQVVDYLALEEVEGLEMGRSYWVKVQVRAPKTGSYVLIGGNSYMRVMKFYDGTGQLLGQGNHVFLTLDASPHTYQIYYPFADEKDRDLFTIELIPQKEFLLAQNSENMFQFGFQAILLFLTFISLVFGVSTRDRVYYYYALYLFSISWFFGYQAGLLGRFFPVFNQIAPMWFWLFAFTITLFYALFTIAFLDMKSRDLKALRIMQVGIGYMCFLFLLSTTCYIFRLDVQHTYWYKIPTISVEFLLIGMALIRIWRFQGPVKKYYLIGVFILVSVSLIGQLSSTIQLVGEVNDYIQAGLLLETFLLSLGLGVRVDQIQKARNESQKAYIDQLKLNENLQLTYTKKLEDKVKERTDSLDKRNKENELLLKEIHHRVKNNLQMITSLINMQQRRVKNKAVESHLISTVNKIKSIALIHEHLYVNDTFSRVNMKDYLSQLVDSLLGTYGLKDKVKATLNFVEFEMDLEHAIPVGLIINELVINSIKYALSEPDDPVLDVDAHKDGNQLLLAVRDNGQGFSVDQTAEGLGFTIIRAILQNSSGQLSFDRNNDYFQVKISIRLTE